MLEIRNLQKAYGNLVAVNGISFNLKPGDIFGFIGSNGAGKTTTIKMLATLLEPTAGDAILNGASIIHQPIEVKKQIGYMPDFFGLYDDITVFEYLEFFAAIYQTPINQRATTIDSVLELTDLTIKKNAYIQSLSRGMQQRLCLAKCLIHDPKLLLLDEPASGLDPRARAELKELILELGRMGKIVIVSSHILPELSDFCNCVGIIERGNLLAFGPVDTVVRQIQPVREIKITIISDINHAKGVIERLGNVTETNQASENTLIIKFDGDATEQAQLLSHLIHANVQVVSFVEHTANLEDVFLRLSSGALN